MKDTIEKTMDTTIYKEVVVIGNGPSGIVTSLMLSGHLPYFVSNEHPDEMLNARLKSLTSTCLISQDLEFLAQGLEGRSTNAVSLLMDALLHPCADLGLNLDPLVEFRPNGKEIDHVVLGRGPPGGCWHRIDPDVLTLSLSTWMGLPGKPFPSCNANEKRAFSQDVAEYYEHYVAEMGIGKYFVNNTVVMSVNKVGDTPLEAKKKTLWVKKLDRDVVERVKDYFVPVTDEMGEKRCFISNAINCLLSRNAKRMRHCKRARNLHLQERLTQKPESLVISKHERKKSLCCCSCCGDEEKYRHSPLSHSQSYEMITKPVVPFEQKSTQTSSHDNMPKWMVECTDLITGQSQRYSCKYLVLACGTYDSPNRLEMFNNQGEDPEWLVHDLRSLETKLDSCELPIDPVLIVGAGLSAADAVMAVRSRNIPVYHVFRGKFAEFTKHLPENMYPEYHKVRQMMNDDGSTYPLYQAFPEHSLKKIDNKSIIITSQNGEEVKLNVSFAAVLIGSKPNLNFLPKDLQLGIDPNRQIDSKSNPININLNTYEVEGQKGLFAIGPLAGDNFVRYIPGGAVAVIAELYKRLEAQNG